jgi:hypothetical protein
MEALLADARNQIRDETETARSGILRDSQQIAQMITQKVLGRS